MHIFNSITKKLLLLLGLAGVAPLHAAPRISEFVALNTRSLVDEDGESSDWIEIENTDGTAVSLEGWYLTDDPEDLTKWAIPAVTLPPNDYLVIFASDKDRTNPAGTLHTNFTLQPGEFVGLVEPDGRTIASSYDPPPQFNDISYGVGTVGASIISVPVDQGTNGKYFVAATDPGAADWRIPTYDDSAWSTAAFAYGWDTTGPYLDLLGPDGNLSSVARGVNASIYVRIPVTIDDPGAVLRMVLDLNWEDGVVGYLNGQQVLAENAPDPIAWDSVATSSHRDTDAVIPDTYELDFSGKLVAGTNILAFQVMNTSATGSDLLLLPKLTIETKDEVGGEVEAFFEETTPGKPNSPGKLAPAYVTVDTPTKTFVSESIVVSLTSDIPGATIRYTTDGEAPTNELGNASPAYTGPLTFTENTLLRTRAYLPGALPGPIETRAYFRLEGDAEAFTSNLPTVLIDNFGRGSIPSAGATTRLPMIMAIFEPKDIGNGVMRSSMLNPPDLVTRMGSRKRGSSSGGWPKNHFSVEAWTENNYEEKNIEPLGFGSDNDWILGSFYQFDRALIRNPFIYDISRQMGRFAARTQHVELWNNLRGNVGDTDTDYFGVYTLGERLDRGDSRIDVDSLNATIMEKNFAAGAPGADAPFDADVSGGYIFKRDRGSPTFSAPGMGNFVYVYPSGASDPNRPDDFFINRSQTAWLSKYLEEADDALDEADGINPDTGLHFSDYIDVDSFIDHIMLNNFAMNVDWGRLSAFLHKPRGEKLQGGPIWDFDRNMGSEDGRDATPDRQWNGTGDSSRTWFDSRYSYYGKVMGYFSNTQGPPTAQSARPDVMQRWIDRWFDLRKTVLSIDNIDATVDAYADPLNVASGSNPALPSPQDRNFDRWNVAPNGGSYSGGDRGWTGEITHMKGWLKARAEWIDDQFPEVPEFSVPGGSVPAGTNLVMNFLEGEAYYTTDGSDPRAPGGAVSATAQRFEGGAIDSTVVPVDAPVDYFIPTDASLGLMWTQANFNAAAWTQAATGVGWESTGGTLAPLVATNISDQLKGINGGAYFRWEFDFNNAGAVNGATLNVNSDDGFVAYLNGVEIASVNAPDPVAWNSTSSGSTTDTEVVAGAQIDVSAFTDAFRNGTNVLAIHAMNSSVGGSDFLIRAGLDINETVVANPLVLNESQTITARVRQGDFWGAPTVNSYAVGTVPATAANLMVSEIMYHPSEPSAAEFAAGFDDQDLFEFIEFVNISDTAIDMSGVTFGAGVNFAFPGGLQLAAGARVVVVSDVLAFRARYGMALDSLVVGQFQEGTNLSNSGERILILGIDGTTIREFTYNDKSPWPEAADGDGFSLVLNSPNSAPDHNLPASWTTGVLDGTPGADENKTIFVGDPNADGDNDGLNAFVEYALGTSDSNSASGPGAIRSRVDGGGDLRITYPKNTAAGDVIFIVEISIDLIDWASGEMVEFVGEEPIGGGISEVTYQSAIPDAPEVYMRLRILQQ